MNRIYRVVWSASLGMYQVASEVASSHGKATRSVDRRARRAAVAAAALMAASGAAMAQSAGSDYSSILTGLDVSTAVTAVISAGALLAAVGFAKWATKKVARFFG